MINSMFSFGYFFSFYRVYQKRYANFVASGDVNMAQTAFTRCRHILKTVKTVKDRPPVHTKKQFLPAGFENGKF